MDGYFTTVRSETKSAEFGGAALLVQDGYYAMHLGTFVLLGYIVTESIHTRSMHQILTNSPRWVSVGVRLSALFVTAARPTWTVVPPGRHALLDAHRRLVAVTAR
jgi:hypothetical protein